MEVEFYIDDDNGRIRCNLEYDYDDLNSLIGELVLTKGVEVKKYVKLERLDYNGCWYLVISKWDEFWGYYDDILGTHKVNIALTV